ncbi:VIT1/CCC1 transporter family protein [Cellulomonas sp. PS-H5]|uniref:VIT1/CCC1 transporter family protein n=1 Tax=Cellulomonas sp. PS-H5 TaxID=2820400 RepID=UPI001C4FEBA1|nr:VIT1/CCC1 transporter family protein [Cellulomonas sp. PS-H5]MBW0253378.1 VIT1/CCC1 transporter family protein [Cellulomonas sp. PS-H5]
MSALSTHLLDRDRTAAPASRRAPEPGAPGSVDPGPGAPSAVVLPTAERLNWLRAGVLGANDGIVSVAATVVGVAGASTGLATLAVAGVAALVAGALSMAAGEYVSVSSQRDAEKVLRAHGVRDAEESLTNPWHAALASLVAFVVGGVVPLLAMLGPWGGEVRVVATFAAVVAALVVTGTVSARMGGAPAGRAVLRNVVGGSLAMAITYGVGSVVGLAV